MKEVLIDNVLSSDGLAVLLKRVKKRSRLGIALMATASCKDILAKFVVNHADFFRSHLLFSTSGTSSVIRSHLDIAIESVGHGPDGGDVVVANKILNRECDFLILFRGTQEVIPHEEDIRMLLRIANMSNCIVATNVATASLVVMALSELLQTAGRSNSINV